MKLLLKHIFRNIGENRIRGLLIIFSLAVSSFVLYMNFISKNEVIAQYESLMTDIYNGYEINILGEASGEIDKETIHQVKKHEFVTDTIPISSQFAAYIDKDSMTIQFYATNLEKLNNAKLISTNVKDLKEKEIVISHSFAEEYDYHEGDELELLTAEGPVIYKVVDVAKNDGLFTDLENVNTFIIKEEPLDHVNLLLVQSKPEDIQVLLKELKKDYPTLSVISAVDRTYMNSNVFMLEQALVIVLIITAALNFLIISSNAKAILLARRSAMGTFRSLGATQNQIVLLLLLENIIYGVIGGITGFILILFGKNILITFILKGVIGVNQTATASLIPSCIILTILFSIVVQIVSVIPQIRNMAHEPIKGLILGEEVQKKAHFMVKSIFGILFLLISFILWKMNTFYSLFYSLLALVFAISGGIFLLPLVTRFIGWIGEKIGRSSSRVFELAAKNIISSEATANNIRLSTLSITLVLLLVITTLSIQNIFSNISDFLSADYQIYGMTQQEEEYDSLQDIQGIKKISFASQLWDEFDVNGKKENFILAAFDREELGIKNDQGRIETMKFGECMIDTYYAIRTGIKIGDELIMENSDFKVNKHRMKMKVVGTIDSTSYTVQRNVIAITPEQFKEEVRDTPSVIYVYCNAGANMAQVKKDLYTELTGENAVVQSVQEYFNRQEQSVSSIISILWVFLGLAVFAAMIGIINNQIINFVQRKREFAVLNSVAMSRRQISLMIFQEVGISFFIGVICGLGLSLWSGRLMEQLMESLGLFVTFTFSQSKIGVFLVALFILLLLTALIPIRKVSHMEIINEIKYE